MLLKKIINFSLLTTVVKSSFLHLPVIKKRYDLNNDEYSLKTKFSQPHLLLSTTNDNDNDKYLKRENSEDSFQLDLKFDQIMYEVELYIGSNKDLVRLFVDTGSADMVVNSADNYECTSDTAAAEIEQDEDDSDDDDVLFKRDKIQNYCQVEITTATKTTKNITNSISLFSLINTPSKEIIINSKNSYYKSSQNIYPTLTREIIDSSTNEAYIDLISPKLSESFNCMAYGVFNQSNSSTFQNLSVPLDIVYGDGTEFSGNYVIDDIYFGEGNNKISNFTFGLNINSYKQTGILGLGFMSNEYAYQNNEYPKYENFPIYLKKIGLINKSLYSFYLPYNGLSNDSILFGAYDSNGFDLSTGLTLLPIINFSPSIKNGNGPYYISFTLNSISFSTNLIYNKSIAIGNAPIILDTGSSNTMMPYYIFNEILIKFGFQWSNQLNNYVINESEISNKLLNFITFNFQGAIIKVPIIDFTLPVIDGKTLSFTGLRSISITSANIDYFLFGDDFLSSIYFIVDLDDQNIAIGQVNQNKSSNNIITVNDSIPHASKSLYWNEIYGYNGSKSLKLVEIDDPNKISTIKDSDEDLELYALGYGDNLEW
ncbi:hypothetical protein C6P40_001240 [Pichia californica]|uniref:Peptidase A1 domain-containing protein n=1 Tax=Pichia californica TaxID=460514 RepID=A0A9P6WPQ9_9ASCO|nr:hypothetical protein C6P40_001240 [[Candida] californica]